MFRFSVGGVLLLLLFATSARAQIETGQITGKITDPSGSPLPGATVTIKSTETAAERVASTNSEGIYVLPNLQPGRYEVSIAADGFAPRSQRLYVRVGSRNTLDFRLSVAAAADVSSNVNVDPAIVEPSDPGIETATQTLSIVIPEKMIRDLPTLTRNPYDLVALAGNVAPVDPGRSSSERGLGLSINGQRATSINFLQDGAVNNDQFSSQVGQRIPLEAVQEFRVITGGFSAEYGRASGGVVNVITKSGTNDFHGSAYAFNRVSGLSSTGFDNNANGLRKGVFTRNQFGYSVGGPIYTDRLFFFNSTEWTKVRSRAEVINIVPSSNLISAAAEATRDYFSRFSLVSALPDNNDDNAERLYTKSEVPGVIRGGVFDRLRSDLVVFGQVINSRATDAGGGDPQNSVQSVFRFDYNFSPKEIVTLRFGTDRQTLFEGTNSFSPWNGFNTGTELQNDNLSLSLTQAHSARLITQTRFAFNRLRLEQPLGAAGEAPALRFYENAPATIDGYEIVLPGYRSNSRYQLPFGGPQNVYQIYQDATYLWGRHELRAGGSYSYTQDNRRYGAYQNSVQSLANTGNFGQALDNFLRGRLFSFTGAIDPRGHFPGDVIDLPADAPDFTRHNRYHEAAGYLNDAWRITPRLTLNLGLRYEFFSVPHNKNKALDTNFYFGEGANIYEQIRSGNITQASQSGAGGLYRKDADNFAPRLGFAWDPLGDGRTSLRAGFGIAYERIFDHALANIAQNPPNYAVISLIAGGNVSGINITDSNTGPFDQNGKLTIPQSNISAIDPDLRTAQARFWNVSLQREVRRNLVASLDYSGSKGRDLYAVSNFNRIGSGNVYLNDPCATGACVSRLNNQYADINILTNQGESDYHGVTAGIDGRDFFVRGLLLSGRYTWARAKDNISSTLSEAANNFNLGFLDPFNPALDRGYADYDIRHRLVVSWIWDIPYQPSFQPSTITGYIYKHLLSGLSLSGIFSAQTGMPYSIYDCTHSAGNVCSRLVGTGLDTGANDNPESLATPNRFSYLSLAGLTPGGYVHPLTGTSIFGPFPSEMTGRNSFRGPGHWNLDLGLFKTFRVREWATMQLRAEVYNALNHANLFLVGSETDISRYAYVPARRDGRRNVQFALKIIF